MSGESKTEAKGKQEHSEEIMVGPIFPDLAQTKPVEEKSTGITVKLQDDGNFKPGQVNRNTTLRPSHFRKRPDRPTIPFEFTKAEGTVDISTIVLTKSEEERVQYIASQLDQFYSMSKYKLIERLAQLTKSQEREAMSLGWKRLTKEAKFWNGHEYYSLFTNTVLPTAMISVLSIMMAKRAPSFKNLPPEVLRKARGVFFVSMFPVVVVVTSALTYFNTITRFGIKELAKREFATELKLNSHNEQIKRL